MNNILIDWTEYLESIRDRSSNTIQSYVADVINFLQYMKYRFSDSNQYISISDIPSIDISDIDEEFLNKIGVRDIISYISYTDIHLNNSSSTRSRKLSSLRNFYNYIYTVINIVNENPVSLIDGPKIGTRLPEHLSLDEVKTLLKTINEVKDEFYRYRDYAIIMTFINTGLRISELTALLIDDIKSDSMSIIGKGNKERIIYLNSVTRESINKYLSVRVDSDVEYLFTNKQGTNKLGVRGVQYLVNKYIKKSGLDPSYTPHTLRHTAATLLYQHSDVDIRTLQVLLGHESLSTTQIYTHVDSEQVRTAIDNSPIQNLKIE